MSGTHSSGQIISRGEYQAAIYTPAATATAGNLRADGSQVGDPDASAHLEKDAMTSVVFTSDRPIYLSKLQDFLAHDVPLNVVRMKACYPPCHPYRLLSPAELRRHQVQLCRRMSPLSLKPL